MKALAYVKGMQRDRLQSGLPLLCMPSPASDSRKSRVSHSGEKLVLFWGCTGYLVYPFQKMSEPVSVLLCEVPAEVHFVLRDGHFNTLELHEACEHADRLLMTT